MDYAEFWALETAVEFGVPFSRIVGPPAGVKAQWNKPHHGLSRSDMLNLLDGLARSGDIVAGDVESKFVPSRRQIDEWLYWGDPIRTGRWYFLTPKGGCRWEQFANADWDRYHSFDWDEHIEDMLEITSTTPEVAERAYRYNVPWNELRVSAASVTRTVVRPWAATYWKMLPEGHAVRFQCEYLDDLDESRSHFYGGMSEAEVRQAEDFVLREYRYFAGWYTAHPQTPAS